MKLEKIKQKQENKSELVYKVKVEWKEIEKGIKNVYKENIKYFNIPGFRKGKVPFEIVVKYYGKEMFLQDGFANVMNSELFTEIEKEVKKEKDVLNITEILPLKEDNLVLELDKDAEAEVKVVVEYITEIKGYDKLSVSKKEMEEAIGTEKTVYEEKIKKEQASNSSREARTDKKYKIVNGDSIELSFKGYVKNENGEEVPFEGGESERHNLVIGSHSFIDNFEEQLIGLKLGDKKDVKVTFPKDYTPELAGKEARFEIEILTIYETITPEINDDFAQDLGFKTLAEMEKSFKEDAKKEYEEKKKGYLKNKTLEILSEKNKIDVSEEYIEFAAKAKIEEEARQYKSQGMDILSMLDENTYNMMLNSYKERTEKLVKQSIIAKNIIKQEKIKVLKKDKESALEKYNKSTYMSVKYEDLEKYPDLEKVIIAIAEEEKLFEIILSNTEIK